MSGTTCAAAMLLLSLRLAAQAQPVPPFPACPVPAPAPSGEIWCLGPDSQTLTGYRPSGTFLRQVRLSPIPEATTPHVSLLRDLAVKADRNYYIPAPRREWRTAPLISGAFVFDPAGRWTRTVRFDSTGDHATIEVRHIAVNHDGAILALGYPPCQPESCFRLYRLSPEGNHLGAFFPCPALSPAQILAEITARPIFTSQGRVCHIALKSKTLTTFDQFGRQLRY